jgi:hypothetical protein
MAESAVSSWSPPIGLRIQAFCLCNAIYAAMTGLVLGCVGAPIYAFRQQSRTQPAAHKQSGWGLQLSSWGIRMTADVCEMLGCSPGHNTIAFTTIRLPSFFPRSADCFMIANPLSKTRILCACRHVNQIQGCLCTACAPPLLPTPRSTSRQTHRLGRTGESGFGFPSTLQTRHWWGKTSRLPC